MEIISLARQISCEATFRLWMKCDDPQTLPRMDRLREVSLRLVELRDGHVDPVAAAGVLVSMGAASIDELDDDSLIAAMLVQM